MPVKEFFYGLEMEGFFKGKEGSNLPSVDAGVKTFVPVLVVKYNEISDDKLREDFSNGSHPGHHEIPDDKVMWTVASDSAIGDPDLDAVWPEGYQLEFVSRKLRFGPNSDRTKVVTSNFATRSQILEAGHDTYCTTHVHISSYPQGCWSLEQAKQTAKAVIYFEEAFQLIWAPSRRGHDLTQRNKRDNHKLMDLTFEQCRELIDKCANKKDLFKIMQAGESKKAPPTRDYAWNFQNTLENGIGSIEFRCAPGVTTAPHCLIWVEFAVSFVQAASQISTSRLLTFKGDDKRDLKQFILEAHVDGMNEKDLLEILFQDQNKGKGWQSDDEMWAAFDKSLEDLRRSKPEPSRPWAAPSSK